MFIFEQYAVIFDSKISYSELSMDFSCFPQLMSGSREIIDMNLGPVESKRVSSASSVEGETTPDEKRGILAILAEKNSILIKSLFIRVMCFFRL